MNHAVDLNSFYGYAPAINRTRACAGRVRHRPELSLRRGDPTVLRRRAHARNYAWWRFTTVNHLDIAVSQTSNPTGAWNIYKLDVTNDGTNTGGTNPGPVPRRLSAYRRGRQRVLHHHQRVSVVLQRLLRRTDLALPKAQLAAGAASVTVQHIDTSGLVDAPSETGSTQPGFTLWPAQSPGTGSVQHGRGWYRVLHELERRGRGDEAHLRHPGPRTSNQIVVWTLSNTASLNRGSPALSLSNRWGQRGSVRRAARAMQPGAGAAPDDPGASGLSASTMRPPRRSLGSVAGICLSVRRCTTRRTRSRDAGSTRTTPACSR